MPPEQTERLADLVASALECAVAERTQFLSDVCGSDVALREEAESLLRFEEDARDFIGTPAYELAAEVALNGASDPVIAQDAIIEDEQVIDFGSSLQTPETQGSVTEIAPGSARKEQELRYEPPLPPEKIKDSFEIPTRDARQHIPSRPAQWVWAKRVAFVAVALSIGAMAVGLNSLIRDVRKARHERDVAQAEEARAERINNFLQQILSFSDQNFTAVWPVPQKRNVTVSDMLDRIAPRVQGELADQPDVRGEVLRRIGDTYASQGDHDAAEKNLRAALQAQIAFHGEESARVTETMVDLGVLLYRREKFAEAERFLEKGVAFLRKQNQTEGGRSNAIKLAYALDQLGAVKFFRGDVKGGRAILEDALRVATQAQPREHDRFVLTNIKTDLGGLLVLVGDFRKGETLLDESLAESRIATSVPKWETGTTLQMLGELALAKNRPREAKENFLEAEGIYRETLGEKNLYFARNLERRATASLLENDLPAAEELARKSLTLTKKCSPEHKLPLTDPMMTLSSVLIKQGRVAEGEDYLRQTLRICEEQPTRNYAAIGLAKIRLSQLLLSQDRFTEAENLAFEAHSQTQQHLEPEDPIRKATANNLMEIYAVQKKNEAVRSVR